MTKSLLLFTALATVALAVPAFAADESGSSTVTTKSDSDGNFTKKTNAEHTDAAGTTTKSSTDVKVKTDSNGNVKKTVESDSSTDPKGLMNKTTSSSKTTVEKNADGTGSYAHKEKVNGTTVEDEKTESK